MLLDAFDFDLPEELIALRPVRPRAASRLLVSRSGGIEDRIFGQLGKALQAGDLLVFNDTRVIPGRLAGTRRRAGGGGGARIEATLIEALPGGRWRALARPAKRLAAGDRIDFGSGLEAELVGRDGAEVELAFTATGGAFDVALEAAGAMPLPPYIASRRPVDAQDREDYQTIFAERPGAVAAPTAALHFDAPLVAALEAAGIGTAKVTLHVGAGTFLPVKVENIETHRMHSETGNIDAETAERVADTIASGGRVIPVGTTSLRVLETAATGSRRIAAWSGSTDIFIRPGFEFGVTDALITNFHLPKSTLLMLVAALIGMERMQAVYAHAIEERYRFFSYGDLSLLFP